MQWEQPSLPCCCRRIYSGIPFSGTDPPAPLLLDCFMTSTPSALLPPVEINSDRTVITGGPGWKEEIQREAQRPRS